MSETPGYQRLFAELKRRKVFKVAAVYGAVCFGVLQVADILVPAMALPDATITLTTGCIINAQSVNNGAATVNFGTIDSFATSLA